MNELKTEQRKSRHRFEKNLANPFVRPRENAPSLPNVRTRFAGSSECGGPGPSTLGNRSRQSSGFAGSPKRGVPGPSILKNGSRQSCRFSGSSANGGPGPSTLANSSRRSSGSSANSLGSPKSPATPSSSTPSRYRSHHQRGSPSPTRGSTPTRSHGGQPSPVLTPTTQYWSFQVEGSNTRVYRYASPKGKGKPLKPMASVKEQDLIASRGSADAGTSRDRDEKGKSVANDETVPLIHGGSAQDPTSHPPEENSHELTAATAVLQNGEPSHHPNCDGPTSPPTGEPTTIDTPFDKDSAAVAGLFPNHTDVEEEINRRLEVMKTAEAAAAAVPLSSSGSSVFDVDPDAERRYSMGSPEAADPSASRESGLRRINSDH